MNSNYNVAMNEDNGINTIDLTQPVQSQSTSGNYNGRAVDSTVGCDDTSLKVSQVAKVSVDSSKKNQPSDLSALYQAAMEIDQTNPSVIVSDANEKMDQGNSVSNLSSTDNFQDFQTLVIDEEEESGQIRKDEQTSSTPFPFTPPSSTSFPLTPSSSIPFTFTSPVDSDRVQSSRVDLTQYQKIVSLLHYNLALLGEKEGRFRSEKEVRILNVQQMPEKFPLGFTLRLFELSLISENHYNLLRRPHGAFYSLRYAQDAFQSKEKQEAFKSQEKPEEVMKEVLKKDVVTEIELLKLFLLEMICYEDFERISLHPIKSDDSMPKVDSNSEQFSTVVPPKRPLGFNLAMVNKHRSREEVRRLNEAQIPSILPDIYLLVLERHKFITSEEFIQLKQGIGKLRFLEAPEFVTQVFKNEIVAEDELFGLFMCELICYDELREVYDQSGTSAQPVRNIIPPPARRPVAGVSHYVPPAPPAPPLPARQLVTRVSRNVPPPSLQPTMQPGVGYYAPLQPQMQLTARASRNTPQQPLNYAHPQPQMQLTARVSPNTPQQPLNYAPLQPRMQPVARVSYNMSQQPPMQAVTRVAHHTLTPAAPTRQPAGWVGLSPHALISSAMPPIRQPVNQSSGAVPLQHPSYNAPSHNVRGSHTNSAGNPHLSRTN